MHDIHVHTNLSECAKETASLDEYLRMYSKLDVSVIGFSDHVWDNAVPGSSAWYAPQDVEHVLPLKKALAQTSVPGKKICFGCETEYIGNGVCGLHKDHSDLFDFVLVPPHHFHMGGFVRPRHIDHGKELIDLYLSRFLEVCEIEFAYGIAHPFSPMGTPGLEREILEGLDEKRLEECFTAAAQSNKSIELNLSSLHNLAKLGLLEQYGRIMQIAQSCACRFHIGSDAHRPEVLTAEYYALGYAFAEKCAIILPEDPFSVKF